MGIIKKPQREQMRDFIMSHFSKNIQTNYEISSNDEGSITLNDNRNEINYFVLLQNGFWNGPSTKAILNEKQNRGYLTSTIFYGDGNNFLSKPKKNSNLITSLDDLLPHQLKKLVQLNTLEKLDHPKNSRGNIQDSLFCYYHPKKNDLEENLSLYKSRLINKTLVQMVLSTPNMTNLVFLKDTKGKLILYDENLINN